jgi:arylsulfatase A-like enzyme
MYGKGVREKWHFPGPPMQKDYLTDDLTALSTDWIRRHVKEQPGKPFLLYLAHFAIHDPIEARPEDVAYFEKKKTRGWNGQNNPAYAGMIRALDDSVGAIRDALRDLGVADNTVILFCSDNGAQARKGTENWTSNTPLRGQKAQTFEGGIRVPMIIHLPGASGAGNRVDTPVALEDIAPTLTDLANQTVSDDVRSQWTGQSLVPLLKNRFEDFNSRAIFIHEPYYRPDPLTDGEPMIAPSTVMIDGNYKLIAYHDDVLRLYDLSKDIGERNDLSASMPERVEGMKKRIMQWRKQNIPDRYDTRANEKYNLKGAR